MISISPVGSKIHVVSGGGVVVGCAVVVGGYAGVVVGCPVVVGVVVAGFVVDAGEAAAWAGATIVLMRGFDHLFGSARAVATPPIMTFRTCLRS